MIMLLALAVAATVIPRVDQGNIRSWEVPDARTVYLEDQSGNWFRADMQSACVRLNFNEQMGFRTGPGGRLDSSSQIVTRAGRCRIKVLTSVSGPQEKP